MGTVIAGSIVLVLKITTTQHSVPLSVKYPYKETEDLINLTMDVKMDDSTVYCSREIADKIARGEFTLRSTTSKSRAWCIFAKINDENGEEYPGYVCCRECKKVFIYSKTSTSNLVKHRCYVVRFVLTPENIGPTNDIEITKREISNQNLEYNVDGIDNNLTKLITKCLIKNCRSYELIQDDDFKAVLQEFVDFGAKFGAGIDVSKFLPSPKTVSRTLYDIYSNCFKRIHAEIAAIKNNGFGLAIHIWTNNFLKKNYAALTIHFSNCGIIKSRFLGLKPMEGQQCTHQNISEKINHILRDYDCQLSSKSLIVTSGSIGTMTSQTFLCISELLNTALQKSMEAVPEVVELVSSCLKVLNLLNKETLSNFPEPRFCPSRWISLYQVLNLMAIHWPEIKSALEFQNEEPVVKYMDIDQLKALVETIEPFEEAFSNLEKENKATLHLVLVHLHELRKSCDLNNNEEYNFIVLLKDILKVELEKITKENVTILHKLALFLYPPTKKLLQFSEKEKQLVEAECTRLMKCFDSDFKPTVKQEPNLTYVPVSKCRKLFSDFVEHESNDDQDEFIQQEIQIYKMTRVLYSEDFDVFGYWEQQKDNFPLLYKLSCMVFATPATSVSAQRIFTSAGSLLFDKISGLQSHETNIEHMAFIKFNGGEDELDFKT